MRPLRALVLFLATALAAQLAVVVPASATFTGGNGRIAFETGRTDEFDIWSMQPDGSAKKRLTTNAAEEQSPAFAYAGIVFTRDAVGGGPGDIFRMGPKGSGVTRLTNTAKISEVDPAWSPDVEVPLSGIRIAFSSSRSGHGDLYTIRASDGANLTRLTSNDKADFQPDWSGGSRRFPGGRIVFVSMRTGNGDLYLMNGDGSGLRRLTSSPGFDSQPSWIGEGDKIAFVSDRDGDNEIFVIRADGTGLKKLTDNQANDQGPVWSPESGSGSPNSFIAFMSDRDKSSFEIYTMRAGGKSVRRITHDDFVDGFPTWQPLAG